MTLPSVWQDRTSPEPAEAVDLDGPWDVAVVGGGLTGLTTALLLGRAGQRVLVLEAARVGEGTTGRSTAKLSLLQGTRLSQIGRRHPTHVVEQYVAANREALAWVEQFCEEQGVGLTRCPSYTFAHGRAGVRAVRREYDVARAAGLDVSTCDEVDLPFPTLGAVRLDGQVQLDPVELLRALAAECARHGVVVAEQERVLRVRGSGPVRVSTAAQEVVADHVVVATNMPILDRGGFFARMTPARSYLVAFRSDLPDLGAMYLSADRPSRSLRDARDAEGHRLLLVGGAGHTTGRSVPTSAHLDELRSWTAEHFPGVRETHAWSAQDYVPHHELPYAGPILPGAEHLLVAGGYAKWGMTNGVAAALALSARILGGRSAGAEVFSTWDPHELRGLPSGLKTNVEVGLAMARGWLEPLGRLGRERTDDGQVRYDRVGPPSANPGQGAGQRLSGVCTHLGGVVTWNDAERSWDCPLHGSRFDADGAVLDGPAVCGLRRLGADPDR
ncbi:MAG: FAD-dependent oxidoreductase [Nocardioides sp.]